MKWKNSLDLDSVRNLAHCKGRAVTPAIDPDHNSFERLDPLFFTLNYPHLKPQRVANPELGKVLAQTTFFDLPDDAIHGNATPEQSAVQNYLMPGSNSIAGEEPGREVSCERTKAQSWGRRIIADRWCTLVSPFSPLFSPSFATERLREVFQQITPMLWAN